MLALVAGAGRLPELLIAHLEATGTPYRLCRPVGMDAAAPAGPRADAAPEAGSDGTSAVPEAVGCPGGTAGARPAMTPAAPAAMPAPTPAALPAIVPAGTPSATAAAPAITPAPAPADPPAAVPADPRTVAIDGAPTAGRAALTFRIETFGTLLAALRAEGARTLCLAGAVRRPVVDPAAVDAATAPLIVRLGAALTQGDDAALRAVLDMAEAAGLAVRGAHEVLPALLPPVGVLTRTGPGEAARRDAARAEAVLAALGAADVGQGCVVAGGQVLAVEALPGTDWMLRSLAAGHDGPRGGLLAKAPKPGQDRRVDLPAIGPATVVAAAQAGLDGIVVAAGGVMVLDRAACVSAADAAGLFLWVRG